MRAYYNEIEPYAAAWLRNLISENLIAPGDVDERSIVDVRPDDLKGYTQCHFFAGIGGWSYAARLAEWPDDRPIWTGSCPCQPFSAAGKRKGQDDERHLWPAFFDLIRQCRPERVFGEQVQGAIGFGWLDGISADLEAEGYACGALVLGAHSVGAPHIRQRLYWVADAQRGAAERRRHDLAAAPGSPEGEARERQRLRHDAGAGGDADGLADASGQRQHGQPVRLRERGSQQDISEIAGRGDADRLAHTHGRDASAERQQRGGEQRQQPEDGGAGERVGDASRERLAQRERDRRVQPGKMETHAGQTAFGRSHIGFWGGAEYIQCSDGKARRIEPSIFPLAHGLQSSLDSVFSIQDAGASKVREYAENSQTNPFEIMRMVRKAIRKKSCGEEQPTGVRIELHASEVLFDFLLCVEAALDRTADSSRSKKASREIIERSVRSVRRDGGTLCSPCEWAAQGQFSEQPPATLHELSFVLARLAEAHGQAALAAHAAFNRLGTLRGAGNAIVPQVAAEFMMAATEALAHRKEA